MSREQKEHSFASAFMRGFMQAKAAYQEAAAKQDAAAERMERSANKSADMEPEEDDEMSL